MRKLLLASALMISVSSCQSQNFGNILKQANDVLGGTTSGVLTTDEIGRGLKEALTVGIKNSSSQASALDGYLGNQTIKLFFQNQKHIQLLMEYLLLLTKKLVYLR